MCEDITHWFTSAHFFAGCGGDICGLQRAGWHPQLAVELKKHRCRTLRANHPALQVFEGPIQAMTNADYPPGPITLFFLTFPCDRYTLAANVHRKWTGDQLYLEALREVVLHYPELVVIENVWGIRKFKRVMETFRALPMYHCTECVLFGDDFTHQKKTRVFLILHRQPYAFPAIETYRLPRPGKQLKDYLEMDAQPIIPNYVYSRLDGKYRDLPKIYDPEQYEPVNLFSDIGKDRSNFLLRWPGTPRGVRIFTPREQANLHGFPSSYTFMGSLSEQYDMVVDSVMPPMAYAIGRACMDYLRSIPRLAEVPQPLGYREIPLACQRQAELNTALRILQDPEPLDPRTTTQLALW